MIHAVSKLNSNCDFRQLFWTDFDPSSNNHYLLRKCKLRKNLKKINNHFRGRFLRINSPEIPSAMEIKNFAILFIVIHRKTFDANVI